MTAGKLDLHVDRGTTFRFSFVWGTREEPTEEEPEPELLLYDLEDATAVLLIWGRDNYPGIRSWSWQKSYPATIDEDSRVWVELTPDESSGLPSRPEYAVEVTFPNGDVRHALEGHLVINHDVGVPR